MRIIATILLLVFSQLSWAAGSVLSDFRIHAEGENERLVFVLDKAAEFKLYPLRQPERLVIDLSATELKKDVLENNPHGQYVAGIRIGKRNTGIRLVIDLKQKVNFKDFVLKGKAGGAERLVVDLSVGDRTQPRTFTAPDSPKLDKFLRKAGYQDNSGWQHGKAKVVLTALEQKALKAPEVLIADAILKSAQSQLSSKQAESGFQLYGSLNVGNAYDRTSDSLNNDTATTAEVGIRYPLLGNRATEKMGEMEARTERDIAVLKKQIKTRAALQAIRDQYVDYWANTQRLKLVQAYIQDQADVSRRLALRKSQGLLLEVDRLELVSTFDYAKTDLAQYYQKRSDSLAQIRTLAAEHTPDFDPFRPDFSQSCSDESKLRLAVANADPELQMYKVQIDEQLNTLPLNKWQPIKSSLYAGKRVSDRDFPVDGDNWNVGLTVTTPLHLAKAMKSHQDQSRASLQKFQLEMGLRTEQILTEVKSSVNQYRTAENGLRYAVTQLQGYREGLREAALRRQYLDGDVIEKLQKARYQYYRSALKAVDAQVKLYRAQVRLLNFLPEGCGTRRQNTKPDSGFLKVAHNIVGPLASPASLSQTTEKKAPGLAMYVWDSDDLLAQHRAGKDVLGELKTAHINKLLISLNAAQIEKAAKNQGDMRLFLEAAHARNMQIELLLGDPYWILPEYRSGLLATLEKLKSYPFDGLHLDLEPEQLDLYKKQPDKVKRELIHTLHLVKAVSPWPLSLSTHYRNLKETDGDTCLGCALENIGVKELTLMIYVANPKRVAEIARPILKAYPGLSIGIAQSVEPFLPREETLWGKSRKRLLDNAREVSASLGSKNFSSTVIQSWSYYKDMM